jgi:hypothetical protein
MFFQITGAFADDQKIAAMWSVAAGMQVPPMFRG